MTAAEAIRKARLYLGVLDRFGEPTPQEYSDGLSSLNLLISRLGVDRLGVSRTATAQHTCAIGAASFTVGPTGQVVTTRPFKIEHMTVNVSGVDSVIVEMTAEEYQSIAIKSTATYPERFYYDKTDTNGTIYLYPVPDSAYSLTLTMHQPIAKYSASSETISLPEEFTSHIPWGLAIDIAPEDGAQVPETVALRARETLAALKRVHASYPAANTDPFRTSQPFNIMAGE